MLAEGTGSVGAGGSWREGKEMVVLLAMIGGQGIGSSIEESKEIPLE